MPRRFARFAVGFAMLWCFHAISCFSRESAEGADGVVWTLPAKCLYLAHEVRWNISRGRTRRFEGCDDPGDDVRALDDGRGSHDSSTGRPTIRVRWRGDRRDLFGNALFQRSGDFPVLRRQGRRGARCLQHRNQSRDDLYVSSRPLPARRYAEGCDAGIAAHLW